MVRTSIVSVPLALAAVSIPAAASVTVLVTPTGLPTPAGAYIRADIANCQNPTVTGTGAAIPVSRQFPLNRAPSIQITLEDNVSQISCNGNHLSYYTFSYVANGVTTPVKSTMLPSGTFPLSNLANITSPPVAPGIVQGPPGPAGADGAQGAVGPAGPAPSGTGIVKSTSGVAGLAQAGADYIAVDSAGNAIANGVNTSNSPYNGRSPFTYKGVEPFTGALPTNTVIEGVGAAIPSSYIIDLPSAYPSGSVPQMRVGTPAVTSGGQLKMVESWVGRQGPNFKALTVSGTYPVTAGAIAVEFEIIGASGGSAAVSCNGDGGNGTATTFNAITAQPGAPGLSCSGTGGAGGFTSNATDGYTHIPGQTGGSGYRYSSTYGGIAGCGNYYGHGVDGGPAEIYSGSDHIAGGASGGGECVKGVLYTWPSGGIPISIGNPGSAGMPNGKVGIQGVVFIREYF